MQEGLYVTLTGDGRIKKHLSTIFGEMPLDDISIGDELIQFSEKVLPMNFEKDPQWVMEKVQEIETNPMIYMDFQEVFQTYLIMMMEHDPVHSALSRTKLEDKVPPPARDVTLLKENILTCHQYGRIGIWTFGSSRPGTELQKSNLLGRFTFG